MCLYCALLVKSRICNTRKIGVHRQGEFMFIWQPQDLANKCSKFGGKQQRKHPAMFCWKKQNRAESIIFSMRVWGDLGPALALQRTCTPFHTECRRLLPAGLVQGSSFTRGWFALCGVRGCCKGSGPRCLGAILSAPHASNSSCQLWQSAQQSCRAGERGETPFSSRVINWLFTLL